MKEIMRGIACIVGFLYSMFVMCLGITIANEGFQGLNESVHQQIGLMLTVPAMFLFAYCGYKVADRDKPAPKI